MEGCENWQSISVEKYVVIESVEGCESWHYQFNGVYVVIEKDQGIEEYRRAASNVWGHYDSFPVLKLWINFVIRC